ncbi:hypothetical protein CRUP_004674, partial [Coryphaenoides rupestris]
SPYPRPQSNHRHCHSQHLRLGFYPFKRDTNLRGPVRSGPVGGQHQAGPCSTEQQQQQQPLTDTPKQTRPETRDQRHGHDQQWLFHPKHW